jgi:hypothetical protein
MKRRCQIFFIFCVIFLQACSSSYSDPQNEVIFENEPDTIAIPTPDNQTGVVFGILRSNAGDVILDGIFLSRNVSYENPEVPPTISFSFQNSPRAIVDAESGIFYFSEIEPAENYVLTVLQGPELMVVKEDVGDFPLQISIQAGESIDLGSLIIDLP